MEIDGTAVDFSLENYILMILQNIFPSISLHKAYRDLCTCLLICILDATKIILLLRTSSQNSVRRDVNGSMAASENALTLDDSLTCEPAN